MKRKLITGMNYEPRKGEVFTKPSKTVPDQAKNIKDLLKAHATGGIPPDMAATYDEENYFPDLNRMDLTEIDEYKRENAMRISELKEQGEQLKKRKNELLQQEKQRKQGQGKEPDTLGTGGNTEGDSNKTV